MPEESKETRPPKTRPFSGGPTIDRLAACNTRTDTLPSRPFSQAATRFPSTFLLVGRRFCLGTVVPQNTCLSSRLFLGESRFETIALLSLFRSVLFTVPADGRFNSRLSFTPLFRAAKGLARHPRSFLFSCREKEEGECESPAFAPPQISLFILHHAFHNADACRDRTVALQK